jgi:hypothetical protein
MGCHKLPELTLHQSIMKVKPFNGIIGLRYAVECPPQWYLWNGFLYSLTSMRLQTSTMNWLRFDQPNVCVYIINSPQRHCFGVSYQIEVVLDFVRAGCLGYVFFFFLNLLSSHMFRFVILKLEYKIDMDFI